MHEISLVRNIFATLESEFPAAQLSRMEQIYIQVGKLSNVEPVLMQNAFQAVTSAEKKYQKVDLKVEVVPVEIYCEDCDKKSIIEQYKFVCNACGKPNNNLVRGTELLIKEVSFFD